MLTRLHRFAKAKSVRAAVGFGVGGVAFSLANLLLARYLTPLDYAVLALLLALKELGLAFGPVGTQLVINRHRLAPTLRLATRIFCTSTVMAVMLAAIALSVYEVDRPLAALLIVIVVGACMTVTASALFQSAEHFVTSLSLVQLNNLVLLLTIPLGLAFNALTLEFVVALVAIGYVVFGAVGWLSARSSLTRNTAVKRESLLIREGLGGLGIGAVALIMWQSERLIIPLALSTEALATFGVLAAVVSAPFRMMQLGMGFTLLPRLRAVPDAASARRLILSELRIGGVICIVGTVAVMTLGPWLIRVLVGDKYQVGMELFVAAVIVGYVRIWDSLAMSTVSALGNVRALALMNVFGWSALGVALLGAWLLRGFGIQGIIYGVGLGWLMQAIAATLLARMAMRQRWRMATETGRYSGATD